MPSQSIVLRTGTRTVASCLDSVRWLDGVGFLITGWLADSGGGDLELSITTPSGERTPFEIGPVRYSRPDAAEYFAAMDWGEVDPTDLGFRCFVGVESLSGSRGTRLEIALESGQSESIPLEPDFDETIPIEEEVRSLAQSLVPVRWDVAERLSQLGPAIEGLWAHRRRPELEIEVRQYGTRHPRPQVSAVIPVYGRYDYMRHQLALMANDPDAVQTEWIYVLDDPRLADAIFERCQHWYAVFGVPFSVVYSGRNLGYAAANNLGIGQARGRYLLLLNSDVFPAHPGWISGLQRALSSRPQAGAVAPVLLYADSSIQHAGMSFVNHEPWGRLWINHHPMKGLPVSVLPEKGFRVQALTGACILVDRLDYHRCGGLDEGYIVGDYEDSDLSLRLHRHGLQCFVEPSIRLFHLERGSHEAETPLWRQGVTLFNCWRQTQSWGRVIEDLIAEPEWRAHG